MLDNGIEMGNWVTKTYRIKSTSLRKYMMVAWEEGLLQGKWLHFNHTRFGNTHSARTDTL